MCRLMKTNNLLNTSIEVKIKKEASSEYKNSSKEINRD